MTAPEDIATLFAEASAAFPAIVGQPEDQNLHALIEVLTPLLLDIDYDNERGRHSLVGLIESDADYTEEYGSAFVRPRRIGAYDESIASDANNVTRAKGEAIWKAKLADSRIYEAIEKATRKFVKVFLHQANGQGNHRASPTSVPWHPRYRCPLPPKCDV